MKKREKKKIVLRRRFPCKNQWNVTMPETSFYTLLRNEKRSFPKQCYKTSNSAHLVAPLCWALPHVQTAGSQGFLQRTLTQSHYAWDHTTWVLHSQHHSPLPQVSHQIHLDGPNWTLKLLDPHIWEANISSAHTLLNCAPIARNCALIARNCAPIAGYQVVKKVKTCQKHTRGVKSNSFELGPNVHPPQEAEIRR